MKGDRVLRDFMKSLPEGWSLEMKQSQTKEIIDDYESLDNIIENNVAVLRLLRHRISAYNNREIIDIVGVIHISQLPHCCGAAVISGGCCSSGEFRKKFLTLAENLLEASGYTNLIVSDVKHGFFYPLVNKDKEWKEVDSFVNMRTRNTVYVFSKNLHPDEEEDEDENF